MRLNISTEVRYEVGCKVLEDVRLVLGLEGLHEGQIVSDLDKPLAFGHG